VTARAASNGPTAPVSPASTNTQRDRETDLLILPIPGEVVGADFSVSSATERLVMVAGAVLISRRAIKLGVDPTVFTGA
jgi:hypothetical protein